MTAGQIAAMYEGIEVGTFAAAAAPLATASLMNALHSRDGDPVHAPPLERAGLELDEDDNAPMPAAQIASMYEEREEGMKKIPPSAAAASAAPPASASLENPPSRDGVPVPAPPLVARGGLELVEVDDARMSSTQIAAAYEEMDREIKNVIKSAPPPMLPPVSHAMQFAAFPDDEHPSMMPPLSPQIDAHPLPPGFTEALSLEAAKREARQPNRYVNEAATPLAGGLEEIRDHVGPTPPHSVVDDNHNGPVDTNAFVDEARYDFTDYPTNDTNQTNGKVIEEEEGVEAEFNTDRDRDEDSPQQSTGDRIDDNNVPADFDDNHYGPVDTNAFVDEAEQGEFTDNQTHDTNQTNAHGRFLRRVSWDSMKHPPLLSKSY